jgi:hypothetical protein
MLDDVPLMFLRLRVASDTLAPDRSSRGASGMAADETDNLVLEHLRHIRAVVDETREDIKRLMLRTGVVERHLANFLVSEAGQNLEIDRIKERLGRIERRLAGGLNCSPSLPEVDCHG